MNRIDPETVAEVWDVLVDDAATSSQLRKDVGKTFAPPPGLPDDGSLEAVQAFAEWARRGDYARIDEELDAIDVETASFGFILSILIITGPVRDRLTRRQALSDRSVAHRAKSAQP